jgi:hypothetical protein
MSEPPKIEEISDKRIALLIAVLALCLALVETGAKSSQTGAITHNVESTNLWAFYQARTIRQTIVSIAAEQAALEWAQSSDAAVHSAIEAQQKAWHDTAERWDNDPKGGEGRRQLMERAHQVEQQRDHEMAQYHLYEYAAAAFQVAIVIASASIVTGVPLLAVMGVALGVLGMALGGVGYLAPEMFHI